MPARSVVSSNPATGEAAISFRISATVPAASDDAFLRHECTNPADTSAPVMSDSS
jgi:hypothetical protein